jgi:hypothetical protein
MHVARSMFLNNELATGGTFGSAAGWFVRFGEIAFSAVFGK